MKSEHVYRIVQGFRLIYADSPCFAMYVFGGGKRRSDVPADMLLSCVESPLDMGPEP